MRVECETEELRMSQILIKIVSSQIVCDDSRGLPCEYYIVHTNTHILKIYGWICACMYTNVCVCTRRALNLNIKNQTL